MMEMSAVPITESLTPPVHAGAKCAALPCPTRKARPASAISAPYLRTVVKFTITAAMLTPK